MPCNYERHIKGIKIQRVVLFTFYYIKHVYTDYSLDPNASSKILVRFIQIQIVLTRRYDVYKVLS